MSATESIEAPFSDAITEEFKRQRAVISAQPAMNQRCDMVDEMVDRGRALAISQTREIIAIIKQRAVSGTLNRGLRLSLPYFDDQRLCMDVKKIDVVPAGRVLFVPAFVVLAMQREEMKINRDARLSWATRKHLLDLLGLIRQAFETS